MHELLREQPPSARIGAMQPTAWRTVRQRATAPGSRAARVVNAIAPGAASGGGRGGADEEAMVLPDAPSYPCRNCIAIRLITADIDMFSNSYR